MKRDLSRLGKQPDTQQAAHLKDPAGHRPKIGAVPSSQLHLPRHAIELLSHELRSPLNAVLGFSALLSSGTYGELTEPQSYAVDRIHENARAMGRAVDNLINFAKLATEEMYLEPSKLDLATFLPELTEPFVQSAVHHGLALDVDLDPALAPIETDPARLSQLLEHLLENALKFTPQGRVRLAIGPDPGNGHIDIRVEDTGIGIEETQQRLVFRPFYQVEPADTRHYAGLGIGLTIARNLSTFLQGELSLQSEAGQGSRFTLSLPHRLDAGRLTWNPANLQLT